jgi:DNA-binding HxlR family transcriptional regulator
MRYYSDMDERTGTHMQEADDRSPERSAFCPAYTHAVEVIGRRWTGAILRSMLAGATRFSEILADVPELSDRLLSQRLKQLEAEGIVERSVTPTTPVRIDYGLTAKGRALGSVVDAVAAWAERWAPSVAEDPRVRAASDLR